MIIERGPEKIELKTEPVAEKKEQKPEQKNVAQERVERGKKEDFSRKETEEIVKIPSYEFRVLEIEKNLRFLSGKKRKDAENDLAWCLGEQKRLVDLVLERVKETEGGEALVNAITPDDLEIVLENSDRYFLGEDKDKEKYYYASERQNNIRTFLSVKYHFEPALLDCVYRGVALRARGETELEEFSKSRKEPEKLSYEYFDPTDELEKIGKFSEEESKLPAREKIRIKKERLTAFKEKTAGQMIGIAKINYRLEKIILEQGITGKKDLDSFLSAEAKTYHLSPAQSSRYRHVFESIEEQAKRISEIAQKYSGCDTRQVFYHFFGSLPIGKTEIEKGPLWFSIGCDDIRDYSLILQGEIDSLAMEKARQSFGFAGSPRFGSLGKALIGINRSEIRKRVGDNDFHYFFLLKEVAVHEKKHILYELTKDVENLDFYSKLSRSDKKEIGREFLSESMKVERQVIEGRAKDEVFAYLKDGRNLENIREMLLRKEDDGGLYDFFERVKKDYFSPGRFPSYNYFDRDLMDEEHEKSRKKYEKNLVSAMEIVGTLSRVGYSRREIIGLFEAEPLAKWSKVFDRLRVASDFHVRKMTAVKNEMMMLEMIDNDRTRQKEGLARELKKKPKDQNLAWQDELRERWRQCNKNYQDTVFMKEKLEKL